MKSTCIRYWHAYIVFCSTFIILLVPSYAKDTDVQDHLKKLTLLEDNLDEDKNLIVFLNETDFKYAATAVVANKVDPSDTIEDVYRILDKLDKSILSQISIVSKECSNIIPGFFNFDQFESAPKIEFASRINDSNKTEIFLKKDSETVCRIHKVVEKYCGATGSKQACDQVVDETVKLIKLTSFGLSASQPLRMKELKAVKENIEALNTLWSEYTDRGRSQTLIELGINSWLYGRTDDFDKYFLPPPKWQLILLHPNAVYEYVDDSAFDGEQGEIGLALELLGIDVWDRGDFDKWYIPSGISATLNAADRADLNDWGYGLMVHFEHRFSVGYIHRDEADALFFSIDLWKWLDSQKKKYQKYKVKWGEVEEEIDKKLTE